MLTEKNYQKILGAFVDEGNIPGEASDGTWFARNWSIMDFIGKEIIPKIDAKKIIVHDIGPGTTKGSGARQNHIGSWYGKPEACSEPYEIVNQLEKNGRDYEINIIDTHERAKKLYQKDHPTFTITPTERLKEFYNLSDDVANYHEEFFKPRRKKVQDKIGTVRLGDKYEINVRQIQKKLNVLVQNNLIALPRKKAHITFALKIMHNLDKKPRAEIQQAFLFHQVLSTLKKGFVVTDYEFKNDKEVKSFGLKRTEEKGPGRFVYNKIKEPKFKKPKA